MSQMLTTRVEDVSNPRVQMALDSIDRQFGEQGGMPRCIKSLRYVQRDGPDLMSDIEDLHPLLGKSWHHVQGGMTESKSELMI